MHLHNCVFIILLFYLFNHSINLVQEQLIVSLGFLSSFDDKSSNFRRVLKYYLKIKVCDFILSFSIDEAIS